MKKERGTWKRLTSLRSLFSALFLALFSVHCCSLSLLFSVNMFIIHKEARLYLYPIHGFLLCKGPFAIFTVHQGPAQWIFQVKNHFGRKCVMSNWSLLWRNVTSNFRNMKK